MTMTYNDYDCDYDYDPYKRTSHAGRVGGFIVYDHSLQRIILALQQVQGIEFLLEYVELRP